MPVKFAAPTEQTELRFEFYEGATPSASVSFQFIDGKVDATFENCTPTEAAQEFFNHLAALRARETFTRYLTRVDAAHRASTTTTASDWPLESGKDLR
jgi:hypothetical protein